MKRGQVARAWQVVVQEMANRPTDAQRMANQARQLADWTTLLRAEDSTVSSVYRTTSSSVGCYPSSV